MYAYGLIGNCQASALVSERGSIDWLCLPRPDSPPILGSILDPNGGQFSISLIGTDRESATYRQSYIENTNILVTEVTASDGSAFRITDFCPRFEQHGRMYRPLAVFRIVEPLKGAPLIRVSCKPVNGWTKHFVKPIRVNSHVRFEMADDALRLTTTMPLTYLLESSSFPLKEKLYFGLTWSYSIDEDLEQLAQHLLGKTRDYWRTWVKHCSIPSLFQEETIRAALTLKLHCYEETGAILAALTTSLPEDRESNRNWDYRFCWLRDAYFVLSAFHNLGHFEEMEGFLKFLLSIGFERESSKDRLCPVYTLDRDVPLPERVHADWTGYCGSKPVRSNNQAAEHIQNDVYGELILALAPIFFDRRFSYLRVREHEELLEHLASLAARSISVPDAGLWEFRNGWREHSFTNLMSWAGLERIERIQRQGYLAQLKINVTEEKERAQKHIEAAVVEGILRNGPEDNSLDTSLALLPVLRFPNPALSKATVEQFQRSLILDDGTKSFFYRYIREDDFGTPRAAFVVCSFWMAQAFAHLGERDRAQKIIEGALTSSNRLGLLPEHFDPTLKIQLGNFPQAYSHVGLINAAFAVSPRWDEIL